MMQDNFDIQVQPNDRNIQFLRVTCDRWWFALPDGAELGQVPSGLGYSFAVESYNPEDVLLDRVFTEKVYTGQGEPFSLIKSQALALFDLS
jgi:hypothetical protein